MSSYRARNVACVLLFCFLFQNERTRGVGVFAFPSFNETLSKSTGRYESEKLANELGIKNKEQRSAEKSSLTDLLKGETKHEIETENESENGSRHLEKSKNIFDHVSIKMKNVFQNDDSCGDEELENPSVASSSPSTFASENPSVIPSSSLSVLPSLNPTVSSVPSQLFSNTPSVAGSSSPSIFGSGTPSVAGSPGPSLLFSDTPSAAGSSSPSIFGSDTPSVAGSSGPSQLFSDTPSAAGSSSPSIFGSDTPSVAGSSGPSGTTETDDETGPFTVCPQPGDSPIEISPDATTSIEKSAVDSLCTLTFISYKPDGDETIIPFGRTYDGNDWERTSSSLISGFDINCESNLDYCSITTPSKPDETANSKFQLSSFALGDISALKSQDIASRFFEQTTFGPTRESLEPFKDMSMTSSSDLNDSFAEWISDQMQNVPITSHRAHFRRLSDSRIRKVKNTGIPNHVCDPNSRWHTYAFTMSAMSVLVRETLTIEAVYTTSGTIAYALKLDGVVRTEVTDLELKQSGSLPAVNLALGTYRICRVVELPGGDLCVRYQNQDRFLKIGNPPIRFLSTNNLPVNVFEMGPASVLDSAFIPVPGTISGADFLLPYGLNEPQCDLFGIETYPIYAKFDDGTYAAFDPRMQLVENTLESPALDGGHSHYVNGGGCANVFRTFLNAESGCVYSTDTSVCSNDKPFAPVEVTLSEENILTMQELTGAYPYVVTGLQVQTYGSPCVLYQRSRFMKTGHTSETCPVTVFPNGDTTADHIAEMLSWHGHNPDTDIRDITYTNPNEQCSLIPEADLTTFPLHVFSDGECWRCVHPDEQSVYDFTDWVSEHPGGPDKITKWAEASSAELVFPVATVNLHYMSLWEQNKDKLSYLGRFKGTGDFRSFPARLQLDSVMEALRPPVKVTLSEDNIVTMQDLTGAYPYVVTGLLAQTYGSPCVLNQRSRFMKTGHTFETCPVTVFPNGDTTADHIAEKLSWTSHNPDTDIRDITYTNPNEQCSLIPEADLTTFPLHVFSDGECWRCVHPDEQSVYDFSKWVSLHPGGTDKITKWAEASSAELVFPAATFNLHYTSLWEENKHNLDYMGRYKDSADFSSFPTGLQLDSVKEALGVDSPLGNAAGSIVCGSPFEVANDPSTGDTGLAMTIDLEDGEDFFDYWMQKDNLWLNVIQNADDQLRQRIAWALSQIFAISQDAVLERQHTESYVYYYDIFVRNSFGNYFDIMKEVSYAPLMAQMLTYYMSQSTAYVLQTKSEIQLADENYAREIMQLFSIGLTHLNMDGTPKLDANGDTILTYSNKHIMSYARAWTGFWVQGYRGNIERSEVEKTINRIDPMRIIPEWRDVFPKIDLKDGFVGDSYALCSDLPQRHFLRKGAVYRLLGHSPLLETQNNLPNYWDFSNPDPLKVKITLNPSSPLFQKLCNDSSGGSNCNFVSQITLDENLECYDTECLVDTLRVIEVTEGVFFEYIRMPCVELGYYNDAKTVTYPGREKEACANPKTEAAGVNCCVDPSQSIAVNMPCLMTNERMSFATAEDRCASHGQSICNFEQSQSWIQSPDCWYFPEFYQWHGSECLVKVKVRDDGMTAIVHEPQTMINENLEQKVDETSPNFFPVYWDGDTYPSTENSCGNGSCTTIANDCLCNVDVVEEQVYSAPPETADDVMSSLFIGSVSPDTFDSGEYSAPSLNDNGDVKIYFHGGNSYNMKTIFEIDHLGKTYYFKNMKSHVNVIESSSQTSTAYSFRNPPHFISLREADARDGHHETQAVLESYFYHPNVPPFLAIHFIQRLGISNPSPRYVETVATAFKNGVYEYESETNPATTYGSGKYGDMSALVASVILDREARSLVLDFDASKGSLKEPLIKVVNMVRSMEYAPLETKYRHTRNGHAISNFLTTKIGQQQHDIQSVFSFFLREFSPSGPIGEAGLVAPDGQRYVTPTVLGIVNGIFSLIKYGLSYCHGGFGRNILRQPWCGWAKETNDDYALGRLTYSASDPSNSEEVIDELATLLTAGRLNNESREIIRQLYDSVADPSAAMRLAQQLIAVTPEFHSTNLVKFSGKKRVTAEPPQPSNRNYKGVVYIYLNGGIDSFNVVVPYDGCVGTGTSYAQYQQVRGSIALPKNSLLPISTTGQPCSRFGIHPYLPVLRDLYNAGDLAFHANVGVLFDEVTQDNWQEVTKTQLFGHNTQIEDSQRIDPFENADKTGVLGRMADRLTSLGYQTGSYSIDAHNFILTGQPQESPAEVYVSERGLEEFNIWPSTENMEEHLLDLNNVTVGSSGKFGKTWSNIFHSALYDYHVLDNALNGAVTTQNFPDTSLGRQLKQAALLIKQHDVLGNDRQFFCTGERGYDTHGTQAETFDEKLPLLNQVLQAFVNEMKDQGNWDDITIVIGSDFGRTLTSNSGEGTDHAWGGNYWTMGGNVKGGKMLGSFPDDLSDSSALNIGRGRLIPTTSWDAIYNGVAEWLGISAADDLDKVLPNRNSFDTLFSKSDMFL